MRLEQIVEFGFNRQATVLEMRVKDVKNLLSNLKTSDLTKLPILEVVTEKTDEIFAYLKPFIVLPANETFDDLTTSEVIALWEAFKKMHPFLAPVETLVKTVLAMQPAQLIRLMQSAVTSPS